MSEKEDLTDIFGKLIGFSFVSSMILGFALIFLAMYNDYLLAEVDAIYLSFVADGLVGTWVADIIGLGSEILLAVPTFIDIIWLISFLTLVWVLGESSYNAKREGYFSVISLMTYGIMVLLFISSIFLELATWFNTEIVDKALPTLTTSTPFFSYYLAHAGVFNAIIIVVCILLNVFDFDFATYGARKDKEGLNNREEAL